MTAAAVRVNVFFIRDVMFKQYETVSSSPIDESHVGIHLPFFIR